MRTYDLSTAVWEKSSRSTASGNNCIEVALNLPGIVALRDNENPDTPPMIVTLAVWDAFVGGAKDGEFDL
ncbi:MAG: hypothetical protein JWP06_1166 [Candidatus Saccharibacteria bacterium]|nr:hypothetical protein [Candidatus Saccharibacteria bacterium]